jgi:hypothetical protein
MRYMIMVKSRETYAPPPQSLMDAIAKLGAEAGQKGVLVEIGGLMPTALGAKVSLTQGRLTVTDGPFTEAKEVIGGFGVYELKTKQDAIYWTERFMALHQEHWPEWEGECEIRQVYGPQEDCRTDQKSHITELHV